MGDCSVVLPYDATTQFSAFMVCCGMNGVMCLETCLQAAQFTLIRGQQVYLQVADMDLWSGDLNDQKEFELEFRRLQSSDARAEKVGLVPCSPPYDTLLPASVTGQSGAQIRPLKQVGVHRAPAATRSAECPLLGSTAWRELYGANMIDIRSNFGLDFQIALSPHEFVGCFVGMIHHLLRKQGLYGRACDVSEGGIWFCKIFTDTSCEPPLGARVKEVAKIVWRVLQDGLVRAPVELSKQAGGVVFHESHAAQLLKEVGLKEEIFEYNEKDPWDKKPLTLDGLCKGLHTLVLLKLAGEVFQCMRDRRDSVHDLCASETFSVPGQAPMRQEGALFLRERVAERQKDRADRGALWMIEKDGGVKTAWLPGRNVLSHLVRGGCDKLPGNQRCWLFRWKKADAEAEAMDALTLAALGWEAKGVEKKTLYHVLRLCKVC